MDHSVVRAIAERAVAAGLVALRFDFRGVRGSGGDVRDRAGHREDVRRASDVVADEAPGLPRLGAGYSYGARAWLESRSLAGARPVAGLLLLAPPSRIPRSPRDFGDLLLGRPIRDAAIDPSVLERLASTRVPTRVLVGGDDVVAPPEELRSHAGPLVAVTVLPGLNHFFARGAGAGTPALEVLGPALDAALLALVTA
jgi:alpha/beta superfamily hydrolase